MKLNFDIEFSFFYELNMWTVEVIEEKNNLRDVTWKEILIQEN